MPKWRCHLKVANRPSVLVSIFTPGLEPRSTARSRFSSDQAVGAGAFLREVRVSRSRRRAMVETTAFCLGAPLTSCIDMPSMSAEYPASRGRFSRRRPGLVIALQADRWDAFRT